MSANVENRVPVSSAAKKVTSNENANKKSRKNLRWSLRTMSMPPANEISIVTKPSLLNDTMECDEDYLLPNGESLKMHIKGNADFVVRVDEELRQIKLRNVYHSADLPWNILSYGKFEERGYDLRYDGTTRQWFDEATVSRFSILKRTRITYWWYVSSPTMSLELMS